MSNAYSLLIINRLPHSTKQVGCVSVYVWFRVCPASTEKTAEQNHRCRKNVFFRFYRATACNATHGIYQ